MATVLHREGNVESWNDERLDELSGRMDAGFKEMREGFARVDREMKEGFARVDREMKEGFARVDREMKEGFAKVDHDMKEGFAKVDRDIKELLAHMDKRFERLDDRFFKLMVVMLVIGGGMISALIAAQV